MPYFLQKIKVKKKKIKVSSAAILLGSLRLKFTIFLYFHYEKGWLVGCFGFNGPLKQYSSLYRAVSQREGERGKKG